jgi:gamma-glutamyltranspeptidase/glutathione hydrolase
MQGAIAAGSRPTAEAGARVLEEGGNAVDACVAAAFAAAVAEGPLTGPTGGGFFLTWVNGEVSVLDCFFAAPTEPLGEMEELVIDFGDASTQIFHVGEGSVAVPGLVGGLEEAHRRFGTVPWPDLVTPAIELARAGVEKTDAQRTLHSILV